MHKDSLSQDNLFLKKTLVALGDFLENFVYSQKGPASIKALRGATQVSEYVVCNEALSRRDNISFEEYIGLTAYDIGSIMGRKPSVTTNAVNVDTKIFNKELPYAEYKQAILANGGFINIEAVSKRSIYSKDNKVIGLLAYAQDITAYVEPLHLFKLYQQYYSNKEAIHRFIDYMKLKEAFYELPTRRELEILLSMKQSTASKDVSKSLQISPKTVDETKGRLRSHLKNITLGELVIKLRRHHELKKGIVG